ncbi:free fatty acid receptor 3-like [Lepisosteus oculatus]|uniref:free fatty acid receptor 3-like n=1 Tax=Lepisosteus oculatus TaxID=7918 RepID=UPI00073FEF32|nr:PREDICTED: free fatty acid receptor 3-like [Lepisosteus oculatus]XP_015224177.1 PREDICTED: free fatty acid receptor 3-like [Lepisosteus oculatus]
MDLLALAVYIVTFLTGLPSNVLALYAFSLKVRLKPLPIDILLINLTVSDLIFLLFLPFKMAEAFYDQQWVLPNFLCSLSAFIFFSTIYISTLFLTAVSVDRYLGVAYPFTYKKKRHPLYVIMVCIFIWIFSSAHCSIVYITEHFRPENASDNYSLCYDDFTEEQLAILLPVRIELCVVLFFIPLIISAFCYLNFIHILNTLANINHKKKQRAIGLALGTLLVFILCFLPYNITHIVGYIHRKSPKWRRFVLLLSTFNACLDPIIFYFSSSAFQETFKKFFFIQLIRRK